LLRIDLANATPGMSLALPVRDPRQQGRVLLKVGYELDRSILQRLEKLGVGNVWIRYPSLEALSKYVDEDILASQGGLVLHVTEAFAGMQRQVSAKLDYTEYCRTIGGLVRELVSNPTAAIFMGDLMDGKGQDLMRHSSSVAYLSLLMGLKLEGYLVRQRKHIDAHRAKEVSNLGIGAMLHDIGVTRIDQEVHTRYMRSGDDTDPAWREHTALGYKLVRGKIEPSAATCILNHHQRFDGSGYTGEGMPLLSGERIHVFARIVGMAEQFDRLRFPPGCEPRPTVAVLDALLSDPLRSQFDPQTLRALFAVVPPYPPGAMLRLSDGRYAVTLDHHVPDPCRPMVQPVPEPSKLAAQTPAVDEPIDLREPAHDLEVLECEGVDVRGFNFPPPKLLQDCSSVRAWL